jgi:2-succinyl-5-enolpyruvyl-6-hydroxy-3-cyclohexene-1-carboxylate synthase
VASGHSYTSDEHASLLALLDRSSPDMRIYGSQRFDDAYPTRTELVDQNWDAFKGFVYVLPEIEYFYDAAERSHFLAVNVVSSTATQDLCLRLKSLSPPPTRLNPYLVPLALSTENLTTVSQWDAGMARSLEAISAARYQKIVLARRKRFLFASEAPPNVLDVVASLGGPSRVFHPLSDAPIDGSCADSSYEVGDSVTTPDESKHANACTLPVLTRTSRGSYLFCLQLDHGHAFVGCTPERLFRLEGARVHAEALAGTVRYGANPAEDAFSVSQLCNAKNMAEHQFVVDYLRAELENAGLSVDSRGPLVVRLPRLMHLATCMTGQFCGSGTENSSCIASVERTKDRLEGLGYSLLETLHPTPAVCGMPRAETMVCLAEYEGFDRGFYAGPIGWFSHEASDFCVAIRSALIHGNEITAYAGSGIVNGSESKSEWDETELKMSAFTDLFCGTSHSMANQRGNRTRNGKSLAKSFHSPASNGHFDQRRPEGNGVNIILGDDVSESETSSSDDDADARIVFFDPRCLEMEPNLNALWASTLVEELCRCGIDQFFVSPGSRSAPLAVAVIRCRFARLVVAHDERGAGFMAVGYARAACRPAAVITSSGTAVANLLPSVVEASNDKLGLLLLTADRPPELRDVGANQTIDQSKIFGPYVRWFKDVPCPTGEIPLRNVLSDADYAAFVSGAFCEAGSGGPVHLNFMFRESLAPEEELWNVSNLAGIDRRWTHGISPRTSYIRPGSSTSTVNGDLIASSGLRFDEGKRGVIFVGNGPGGAMQSDDQLAICRLSSALQWPVFADVASGMRLDGTCESLIPYADLILASPYAAEVCVIQFGERITSKRLLSIISRKTAVDVVLVSPSRSRIDESFSVTHRFLCSPMVFASHALDHLSRDRSGVGQAGKDKAVGMNMIKAEDFKDQSHRGKDLLRWLRLASSIIDKKLCLKMRTCENDGIREPWISRVLSEWLSPSRALLLGNSMPIRDMDSFAGCSDGVGGFLVAANRGASGIDGILSTGIGFALGSRVSTCIVLGDMSFLHDMNALHILRAGESNVKNNVIVLVVNNGGGGIFSLLPIAKHRGLFTPVFDTPHQVTFERIAISFGLCYERVRTVRELRDALARQVNKHCLVEAMVSGDHADNAQFRRGLIAEIADVLAKSNLHSCN